MRAVPWADDAEQQLSRLAPSASQVSADVRIFGPGLPEGAWQGPPNLRLKFELARQASSHCPCASVPAVPWPDEVEQQLSRIAPFSCSYLQPFTLSEQG